MDRGDERLGTNPCLGFNFKLCAAVTTPALKSSHIVLLHKSGQVPTFSLSRRGNADSRGECQLIILLINYAKEAHVS